MQVVPDFSQVISAYTTALLAVHFLYYTHFPELQPTCPDLMQWLHQPSNARTKELETVGTEKDNPSFCYHTPDSLFHNLESRSQFNY